MHRWIQKVWWGNIVTLQLHFFLRTTSSLQPSDAAIFQSFEVKYRKKLLCHLLARVPNDPNATDIVKEVDILQTITLAAATWKEVSEMTIKSYFAKCSTV